MSIKSLIFGLGQPIKNFIKRNTLKRKIYNSDKIKIVIGAGDTYYKSWLSSDKSIFDITNEKDWKFYFSKRKIDNLLAEHVLEHLTFEDTKKVLGLAYKFLNEGGIFRIAVPDAFHPSSYVRELTGIHGIEPGADDHKSHFSITDFEDMSSTIGFKLRKLEYFNNQGNFIRSEFNMENGYISRCSENYSGRFTQNRNEYEKMILSVPQNLQKQFFEFNISYTSLIVDLIK